MDLVVDNCKYSYDISSKAAEQVVEAIIEWCNSHRCTSGEMLCQDDDCMIDGPYLIADIIDNILKPKREDADQLTFVYL